MNLLLIEELEKKISLISPSYKSQLKLATQDFEDYCKPGGVNNWQHPEKPPIQAGLVVAAKVLKSKRILDLGTGLTGLTFKKYCGDAETLLVDSSITWLVKLNRWLLMQGLNNENLFWFDDLSLINLNGFLSEDFQNRMFQKQFLIPIDIDSFHGGIKKVDTYSLGPISKIYLYGDGSEHSSPESSELDRVITSTRYLYQDIDGAQMLDEPQCMPGKVNKSISDIGKFDFIHYDLGGMYTRTAYLNLAIDLLDRTTDSLIYIDDLHKKEVLYESKTYKKLTDEIIERRGGRWLDCKDALTDFQGGYGGIAYFPPLT